MCLRLIKVTGFPQSISTLVPLRARIYHAAHTRAIRDDDSDDVFFLLFVVFAVL